MEISANVIEKERRGERSKMATAEELENEELQLERLESEGGKAELMTPRTEAEYDEAFNYDATAEEGSEIQSPKAVRASVAGCSCNCLGQCPENCPPQCKCAGHIRNMPGYNVSGDEP